MKEISDAMKAMIDSGQFQYPGCQIVCDIDPPFVGKDFNQSGSYPSFCEHNDILYLVFIDGNYIKIAVVDKKAMTVTELLRSILVPGAMRPRLIFEKSTYGDRADLPHIAYVRSDGKVYAYREQYLEDLSIETVTDEIGTGNFIEVVRSGEDVYHFYVGTDGCLCVRKQGEYASILITPDDGSTITGVWATAMPDGRVGFIYSVLSEEGTGELNTAFSNLMLPIEQKENMELSATITAVQFRVGIAVFNKNTEYQNYTVADNGMEISPTITNVQLLSSIYSFNESTEMLARITQVLLNPIHEFDGDSMNLMATITQVIMPVIHELNESMQLTASITAVTLS